MEVILAPVSGPLGQVSSLLFLLGGLYADLLIVRLCLTLAYTFLFILNLPLSDGPFRLQLDGLLWALLGIYVHGSSFCRLLYDERSINLTEREEMVWRLFYRRSRISRLLFQKHILPSAQFVDYQPGETITDSTMPKRLHVIIRGLAFARVDVTDGGHRLLKMLSGDLFEFKLLHLLGLSVGFIDRDMTVTATSKMQTFSVPAERLKHISKGPIATRLAWQSVIIAGLAREAERNYEGAVDQRERIPIEAVEQWLDPAFHELQPSEMPQPHTPGSGTFFSRPFRALAAVMWRTFALPFPFSSGVSGLRHSAISAQQDEQLIEDVAKFVRLATVQTRT
jgi:hypothetical protein